MAQVERSGAAVIDVPDFIERQPIGRGQIRLLLLCAATLFLDGFDAQAIGYVAPALAQEWHLSRVALGPVFSASLVGLMVGALTLSPLADRIGRKWIIVLSTVAFGLGTLATLLADNTTSLIAIRFATGLGLGGAMPNAVAMTAEFSPHRRRATMVMIMFCGFSVGAAVGGFIAAALIPAFGWRSVFLVGGLAPLLLAPALAFALPESVRFLALAGSADGRIAALLGAMFPGQAFATGARFGAREEAGRGMPVAQLFHDGRTVMTLLFWAVFFMSLLDLFFLSNWLPTVLSDLGASVSLAAMVGAMFQVGGVVGAVALGSLIDRFSFGELALTYLLAAFAVAAIGLSSHSIPLATLAIFCAGLGIVGGQTAANALAATHYPTALRATGVGWAFGIGRVGSIVGPVVGGMFLAMHLATDSLFLAAAAPALLAALAAFGLRSVATRHRGRDETQVALARAGE